MQGMTLIEILIVIVIIALAAAGMVFAVGALTRTRLKSSCMKVTAASRFAYSRAITHHKTVRVLFDLSENTIALEEAHGRVTLARASDERRSGDSGEDSSAVDPWTAARERLADTLRPTFGASPFGPMTNREGQAIERYRAAPIGAGIRIVRLYLPHEPEPREEGRGSVYFFPGGITEHAVIQLADASNHVYSVEIHALTGRATVHNFAFAPEPIREDDDEERQSEVEDPR